MSYENPLCKKFMLSADWDRAVSALPEKDKANWSAEDYANRAYARCFQMTKGRKDGNYDNAIEDASQALLKDCSNNRALCIRAYAYYLNNNYEAAITDCEKVIKRTAGAIEVAQTQMRNDWQAACDKIRAADDAKEKAEAAEKAAVADPTDATKKADADAARIAADAAQAAAETAVQTAVTAQEAYCAALHPAAFAHELLGKIYADMGRHLEASKHYKLALLSRQTDIESASPLLMNAYRSACAAVKSAY
jgi:tetratricopeptide (TPR) repeat protein